MDYNYFTGATAQPFQLYGFDVGVTQPTTDDATARYSSMHIDTLAASSMLSASYDYNFDSPLTHDNVLRQTSPTTQYASVPSGSLDSGIGFDLDQEMQLERRASSEEKDIMTPAQSRRKAQNRAAQRAFRERKERHVRDLETRLNVLTTTASSLQSDNERLKALLRKSQVEVEQLRASAANSPATQPSNNNNDPPLARTWSAGSSTFMSEVTPSHRSPSLPVTSSFASTSNSGAAKSPPLLSASSVEQQMLSASAMWDLMQTHPRYTAGCVDIAKVCERLRALAQGQTSGPVFEEDAVRKIINEVGGNGADELI